MRNYKKMSCLDYEIMREIYNFNLLSEYEIMLFESIYLSDKSFLEIALDNDVCIASIFNDRKKIGMSKEEFSYFKKFGVIKKD